MTGQVYDSRTVSDFSQGHYLVWTVRGRVRFNIKRIAGPNVAVSGLFIGPPSVVSSPPPPLSVFTPRPPLTVFTPPSPEPPANLLGLADGSYLALSWTPPAEGFATTGFAIHVTGGITDYD